MGACGRKSEADTDLGREAASVPTRILVYVPGPWDYADSPYHGRQPPCGEDYGHWNDEADEVD